MAIRKPEVLATLRSAGGSVVVSSPRVLLIGQMLTGSAIANTIVSDIQDDNSWNTLFGAGSMLARACELFKKYNKYSSLDALPLADAVAGVQATSTLTLTTNASAAGSYTIELASSTNFTFVVDVPSGATPTSAAGLIVTAVNALVECPVTAANTAGVVTLTHRHKGLEGNFTTVRVTSTVTGQTFTVTAFTGGATNPTLTGVPSIYDGLRYNTVVIPASYDPSLFIADLESKFNVDNDIQDGLLLQVISDTAANARTRALSYNRKTYSFGVDPIVNLTAFKGSAGRELLFETATYVAAIEALRLTEGTDISDYVIAPDGALDTIGGSARVMIPFHNTPVKHVKPFVRGTEFSNVNVKDLEAAGAWTFGNNRTGTDVILSGVVTTYKTDVAGNVDPNFKHINLVRGALIAREYIVNRVLSKYAQYRLTDGDLIPLVNIANSKSISADFVDAYIDLGSVDWLIVEAGDTAVDYYRKNLRVTTNKELSLVTASMELVLLTILGRFIIPISVALKPNAKVGA